LVVEIPVSYANDRWVKANSSSSGESSTPNCSRSFENRSDLENLTAVIGSACWTCDVVELWLLALRAG
jgi:hypothetical protein